MTRTPETAPAHGVLGTYTNYGCRCDLCRLALRDYMRAYRASSQQRRQASRDLSYMSYLRRQDREREQ